MEGSGPPLPEHPLLCRVAEDFERTGTGIEIYDERWRIVFISSEEARILGLDPDDLERFYGHSVLTRPIEFPDEWSMDRESIERWRDDILPIIRWDVRPEDPDFETVFGPLAGFAASTAPAEPPPALSIDYMGMPQIAAGSGNWLGRVKFHYVRLHDPAGAHIGTAALTMGAIPDSLLARLSRGDAEMFTRMNRLREPGRRAAALLFADLEASGELSRRLSSRAYFNLIRELTDVIDDAVAGVGGIIGKHAGDGATALVLADDAGGDSPAARRVIEAGRAISRRAAEIDAGGSDVAAKVGLHWGSELTVGQVSTRGRLEVTALGDPMNEAARIESVASGGQVLASKALLERLGPDDAATLGFDPDDFVYRTVADLGGGDKALRDAGTIAVVDLADA